MKALGVGTGLMLLVAVSALLDPDAGIVIWRELRASLAISNARVEALERGNEALRSEIEVLENAPAGLDRAIREELDLVLPGESIVYFTRAETSIRSERVLPRGIGPRADVGNETNSGAVGSRRPTPLSFDGSETR